jgi:hypothetical protein
MKVKQYDFNNPRSIITRATDRARAKKENAISKSEPEVGIYWLYNGKIFHQDSLPVSHGDLYGDFINGSIDHPKAWDVLSRAGILKKLPEELREEYTSIPRGRVLYSMKKELYIIYHGDTFTDREYSIIREAFYLPADKTVHEIDMHYNPLPDDFEF